MTTNQAIDVIDNATPDDLARIAEALLSRAGEQGRRFGEALLARLQMSADPNIAEGLAQIIAVEGVIDGRIDSL